MRGRSLAMHFSLWGPGLIAESKTGALPLSEQWAAAGRRGGPDDNRSRRSAGRSNAVWTIFSIIGEQIKSGAWHSTRASLRPCKFPCWGTTAVAA